MAAAALALVDGVSVRQGVDDGGRGHKPPCLFWARGKCDRGVNCAFHHDPAIKQDNARGLALEKLDAAAAVQFALGHAEAMLGHWQAATTALACATSLKERAAIKAADDGETQRPPTAAGRFGGINRGEDEDAGANRTLFGKNNREELGLELQRVQLFVDTMQQQQQQQQQQEEENGEDGAQRLPKCASSETTHPHGEF